MAYSFNDCFHLLINLWVLLFISKQDQSFVFTRIEKQCDKRYFLLLIDIVVLLYDVPNG